MRCRDCGKIVAVDNAAKKRLSFVATPVTCNTHVTDRGPPRARLGVTPS